MYKNKPLVTRLCKYQTITLQDENYLKFLVNRSEVKTEIIDCIGDVSGVPNHFFQARA
jgi:hypothetical protein